MPWRASRIILVVLLLGGYSSSAPAANGDITMLGTLPGDTSSIPSSINDRGDVVGYSGVSHPFIWSRAQGMAAVTQVDSPIDVVDVNNSGMMVGRAQWLGHDFQSFLRDPIKGRTNLGALSGPRSEPAAVNDAGTVVGKSTSDVRDRAFRWTADGGMQDLGALGGPNEESMATDISNTSVIVGRSNLTPHAFRWTAATGMQDLHTLGGDISIANGISSDGKTIVGWADDIDGVQRPFRWTLEAGMHDLGSLQGSFGEAKAVNDAGAIVGQIFGGAVGNRPVLWTEGAAQAIDLNDWLRANNPAAADKWDLQYALGINDAGLVIGYGAYSHDSDLRPLRAFVLDVSGVPGAAIPEPRSAAAIAFCTAFLWSIRRRAA